MMEVRDECYVYERGVILLQLLSKANYSLNVLIINYSPDDQLPVFGPTENVVVLGTVLLVILI